MAGILLNLLAVSMGGQVTRAEAFLRRFRRYNPDVRLVILKDSRALSFCDDEQGWKVINLSLKSGRLKAVRRMVWENLFLARLMCKEGLDVYLTFSHYLPFYLGSNVRTIVGVSNLAPFSPEAWGVADVAERLRLRTLKHTIVSSTKRADCVIALSIMCKRVLVERGVDEKKISVIPNGVKTVQQIDLAQPQLSPGAILPYILSVSHFYRYKNFEQLIHAYKVLPAEIQNKYALMIVGKPQDSTYYNEIKELILRLGLGSRVRTIPGLEGKDLNDMYQGASLFVFPSLIENSPNILLEAMSHGLPILSCDIEPMPEFGADAIDYFEVGSANDLSSKMQYILSNSSKVLSLRRRAKDRAKLFSWDTFTEEVVRLCTVCGREGTNGDFRRKNIT